MLNINVMRFFKQKPITDEMKQHELEIWNKNRHLIWVFAVVSSIFAFLVSKSYFGVEINDLKADLNQKTNITKCMFDIKCKPIIEKFDLKSQEKLISNTVNVYYSEHGGV